MDEDVLNEIKSYSQRYPFYPPINKNRDIDSVKPVCNVYTCSFSMDGDLLPMWNYYAQGTDGISINFTEIKDHMKTTEKVKTIWGRIWYTEEEYRAVLIVPEEVIDNNGLPDGYTHGSKQGNTDKPYIDVPFDLKSITNIIVNPYGDFASINADLKDWLQKQNLNDIRIWKSNIPMRKYIYKLEFYGGIRQC